MSTDTELIAAVRLGDVGAVEELHRRHVHAATASARAMLRDATEADAIVNEVFGRVISVIVRGGGPESAFRSYLQRAIRNECVDETRARRDIPSRFADVAGAGYADVDLDGPMVDGWHAGSARSAIDPASVVADSADGAVAREALSLLSDRSYEITYLMDVCGLELAEAAAAMNMAPGAASALRQRGKEKLRQAYMVASAPRPTRPGCADVVSRLPGVIRDTASRRVATRVAAHLEHCRPCRAIDADMRDLNAEIDRYRE